MKPLRESLLGDLEDNLKAGDAYSEKAIDDGMFYITKAFKFKNCFLSYGDIYEAGGLVEDIYHKRDDNAALIYVTGKEANYIKIKFHKSGIVDYYDDWYFTVRIANKKRGVDEEVYNAAIYLNHSDFPDFNAIHKNLIKPMTKDIKVFKKALDNIKYYSETGNRKTLISRANDILK